MGYQVTVTGRAINPLDFKVEDVEHEHIACALGNICRYGGAVKQFYSVAEHSVLGSLVVLQVGAVIGDTSIPLEELKLRFILHDAAEAYTNDIVYGMKQHLWVKRYQSEIFESFKGIEDMIHVAILERYGLGWNSSVSAIKVTDQVMLLAEGMHFYGKGEVKTWYPSSEIWDVLDAVDVPAFGFYDPRMAGEVWDCHCRVCVENLNRVYEEKGDNA